MTTLSRMRSQISSTETFPNGLIVTSGSVGIGTSSPSTKLHVVTSTAQNDSIGAVQLENTAAGAPTNPSNAYTNTSLTTKNIYGTSQFMQWENQGLRLGNRIITNSGLGHVYFTSGNDSVGMTLTASGNVGIGASFPNVKFHVADSIGGNGALQAYIENTSTSGQATLTIKTAGSAQYAGLVIAGGGSYIFFNNEANNTENARISTAGSSGLFFSTGSSSTERMRITPSGNVGIGTSSPTAPLHVYTSSQSAAIVQSTSAIGCNFTLDAINQDARYILAYNSLPKWYIANAYTASNRLYIIDASTAALLYLAQGGTSWTNASDSRLKDVQGTITNALDKVQQLTGVKFTWKRDQGNPDAKVRVGLIAQDVQAVLPEAVDDDSPDLITDEETGRVSGGLGVRYTEIVPLLVNAIKELKAEINELRAQVQGA